MFTEKELTTLSEQGLEMRVRTSYYIVPAGCSDLDEFAMHETVHSPNDLEIAAMRVINKMNILMNEDEYKRQCE